MTEEQQNVQQTGSLPLISVIVPVYKVERFLDRCVRSICEQTYRNLEIILVDDGSPDRCPEMCDAWKARDERIIVLHQDNQGVSSARNAGLSLMTGEYFAFIDSDDYVLPNYFEHLYELVSRNNADMGIAKFLLVDENDLAVPSNLLKTTIRPGVFRAGDILRVRVLLFVWGKLYKTEVCGKYRFPLNRSIGEDMVWLCRVLPVCGSVAVSNKKIYRYTRRDDSASRAMQHELREDKLTDLIEIAMELYRHFKALGLPDIAFRTLNGGFNHLFRTVECGIYLKNGNFKVINRLLLRLVKMVWQEEKLRAVPLFFRVAKASFSRHVMKKVRMWIFWNFRSVRRRGLLK